MRRGRGRRRLAAGALALAAAVAADALWLEPRRLLLRDAVHLTAAAQPLATQPLTIVHLSDLHIDRESGVERRLVAAVAAEQPDLIAVSGDFLQDTRERRHLLRRARSAAAVAAQLRRLAPVLGVQGHSEYLGPVVSRLRDAGVEFLSNEGRLLGRPGAAAPTLLLLGLNQQVGRDLFSGPPPHRFTPVLAGGGTAFGRSRGGPYNAYAHFDPEPGGLADAGGAMAWGGYQVAVEVRLGEEDAETGLVLHSRYPLGEDRMLALARTRSQPTFALVPHGTAFTAGRTDTGVAPAPGRWYRLRVRTEVDGGSVRVAAKAWPADVPEPAGWQAAAEDRSPHQVRAGTVGLWAREGTVAYRHLRVTGAGGALLLDEPFSGPSSPAGWRDGARATRLALALARSPETPRAIPRVALTHVPEAVLEAARRGLDGVLAGHTHGGQVRLPGGLSLLTRSRLGPHYGRGVFDFAAPNPRGWTRLYVNSGVGTSLLPVRLLCPPRYAVVTVGPASR